MRKALLSCAPTRKLLLCKDSAYSELGLNPKRSTSQAMLEISLYASARKLRPSVPRAQYKPASKQGADIDDNTVSPFGKYLRGIFLCPYV